MAFLEYGTVAGLARDFGYNKQADDMLAQAKMLEEAHSKAEAKAKLQADELQHDMPMNDTDRPLAEAATAKHLELIANTYKKYGSNLNNFQAQSEIAQQRKDFLNDPDIVDGVANDVEIKKYDAFAADPKNVGLTKTDDFLALTKQLTDFKDNNYINPDGSKKRFKFVAPGSNFNIDESLREHVKGMIYNNEYTENGYIVSEITQPSIVEKAKTILNGKDNVYYKNEWEKQKERPDNTYKNPVEWISAKIPNYVQTKDMKIGHAVVDEAEKARQKLAELQYKRETSLLLKEANAARDPKNPSVTRDVMAQLSVNAKTNKDGIEKVHSDIFKTWYSTERGAYDFGDVQWINKKDGKPIAGVLNEINPENIIPQSTYIQTEKANGVTKYYLVGEAKLSYDVFDEKFKTDDAVSNWGFNDELNSNYAGTYGGPVSFNKPIGTDTGSGIQFQFRIPYDANDPSLRARMNIAIGQPAKYDPRIVVSDTEDVPSATQQTAVEPPPAASIAIGTVVPASSTAAIAMKEGEILDDDGGTGTWKKVGNTLVKIK